MNEYPAIVHGLILLASNSSFNDEFMNETTIVPHTGMIFDIQLDWNKPANRWM